MSFQDIQFLRMRHVRGPNIWTYVPIIESWVDLGELEDHPSNTIPGYYERLSSWLPGLIEHRCGVGERGGSADSRDRSRASSVRHEQIHLLLRVVRAAG